MAQDITTTAQFEQDGKPVTKDVIVTLDSVPFDLKKRNDLIDQALAEGRYRLAPPTVGSSLKDLASGVGQLAVDYGPSMAAIGIGSARGAAAGAPMGPAGALAGGLGGAILGGIAGRGTTEVIHGLQGQPVEPVTNTLVQGAKTGMEAEALGMPFRALQGVLGGASATPWMVNTPRVAAVNEAKARGIQLTTAETSGSPFFRTLESISERSLTGSTTMKRFAEKQAEQLIQSGEQTGLQFGPPIDATARSNRFVTALQGRISDLKSEANRLFEAYVNAAGPQSPVDLLNTVYPRVAEIRKSLPILPSLQNTKLTNPAGTGILDNLTALERQRIQTLPLEEVRNIRTALGDIAYPDRLAGTVIVDAPVAAARRLYGAFTDALQSNAVQTGTVPLLERANQFQKNVIGNINDSKFYSALLDNERSLTSLSKTLFNPRDPGVLLDAKTVVSPAGWKMLQQQYWDSVFSEATTVSEVGTRGFQGGKFADRLLRDKPIIDILYTPEQAKEIRAFADVARLTQRTAKLAQNDVMGVMVGGGQLVIAGRGIGNVWQGDMAGAGIDAAALIAPWFAAKVFTSPTATQILSKAIQLGKVNPNTIAEIAKYATRAESIRENQ